MDFPAKDASLSNKLELRCQKKVVAYTIEGLSGQQLLQLSTHKHKHRVDDQLA